MDAQSEHEVSGDDGITAADLVDAYCAGVFPMAESADDPEIFWVDPPRRGILPLETFHIPATLRKRLKKHPFKVTINHDFEAVIDGCAARTPVRGETWINPVIRGWFCDLHRMGFAHSVEAWDADGRLAGGLYGMSINGAFFGESMFSRVTDASKVALVHLVARLRARGFSLLDCQFVNPHLVQFGCVEIDRDDYQERLLSALSRSSVSFVNAPSSPSSSAGASSPVVAAESDWACVDGFLQSITVTS